MTLAAAAALIPLQPPAASSIAEDVDQLYYFLTVITLFFTMLIFSTIFFFMIKYRRRSPDEIPPDTKTHLALELTWTIIPTLITVVIFVWASSLYVRNFAAAGGLHRNLRGRQAVDVAHPASRRACAKSTNCTCRWTSRSA